MSGGGSTTNTFEKSYRGRLLILGGSGFLGNAVANKAVLEGYSVTSLSRRGAPRSKSSSSDEDDDNNNNNDDNEIDDGPFSLSSSSSGSSSGSGNTNAVIDYRSGDARDGATIKSLLREHDDYVGVVHCIGVLFDGQSRLRNLNRFLSGSGSRPESTATYDDITRRTAFEAVRATEECLAANEAFGTPPFSSSSDSSSSTTTTTRASIPFVFCSAAEAGWPDVRGGPFVERALTPGWLRRYLKAKREVEDRILNSAGAGTGTGAQIRPVIFRPSLIYSLDRLVSLPPVSVFFVGNRVGLPFIDRPVTKQALANAFVKAVGDDTVRGVQRYTDIDKLNQ